jgi:hypothetical protein
MVTAKITCQGKTVQAEGTDSEQVQLTFAPDYDDGRNKEWARFTPALSLTMTVKPEAAGHFEQGKHYTLTFSEEDDSV